MTIFLSDFVSFVSLSKNAHFPCMPLDYRSNLLGKIMIRRN